MKTDFVLLKFINYKEENIVYILENHKGDCKVMATKELALREAIKMIKEFYEYKEPNVVQERDDYRDVMEQYFDPTKTSFHIDGLFLAYEVEFVDK